MFLGAIFKNEVDAALEWIAYHRTVGVSGFIIADNDSSDGTRELLSALARLGMVTLIDFPGTPGQKPQLPAYQRILRSCPADVDVLAFIDADEFMVPMEGEDSLLPAVERWFADEDVGAVALNWAIFGSAEQRFAEEGLVIERFQRRAPMGFSVNQHYKSLVRPARVERFDNPHHARLRWGRYVDTQGQDLVLHPKHGIGLSAKTSWEGGRVNHYAVKSLEEFLLGKHLRGSAAKEGRIKHKRYFELHDRNDEACSLAAQLAPKVRAEMARIEALLAALPQPEIPESRRWTQRLGQWLQQC